MTEAVAGDPFARGAPFGRFLLVESLGTGTLFEAHRAKSFGVLGFEKDVAVKLLRYELEREPDTRARLVDAARRSTTLCHANILSVLDLGVATLGDKERTYLVTELARGVSLDQACLRLRGDGADVPAGAVLACCADIAKALDHAHRRKGPDGPVVHGALTMQQVFVTPEGEVKVADFAVGSAAVRSGGPAPLPSEDLAALGALLRELSEVVKAGREAILRTADALAGGAVADAGLAHELLIEQAYRLGPDAHQRDPARLAGTEAGAVPPSISVHELVREPASVVPGRELPLVLVGPGERSSASFDTLKEEARRAGGLVLLESPSLVVAFGLVDPDGRDTDLAFVYAQAVGARFPQSTILVTTGVLERSSDGGMRLVLASRSDLLEIATSRARTGVGPRVAASSRASLAARGAFSFEVDAEQPELSWLIAARGVTRTATRFVGRGEELRRLAEAVQGASRGEPRLLRVVGPVGSGKTRLVLELERRSGGRLTLKLARCPRHAQPFDALGAAIRELVGAESPEQVEAKLGALALGAADEHVLGALGGGNNSAARAAFAAVHAAFGELVRRVARGRPLVCVFDDAEHIDAPSLAVVRDVANDPDARALFLLLERREPDPDADERVPTFFVPPLDDDALAALVATRLGARLIPPEVLELFATRTGGVPLVALELVRELVEGALIEVKNGTVVVDKRAMDVVPKGAAELVRSRVAALSDDHLRVLAAAESLARPSSIADITCASGLAADAAERALDALDLAGLIIEQADGIGPVGGAGEAALAGLSFERARELSVASAAVLAARGEHLAAAAARLRASDPAGAAEATLVAARVGGRDAPKAALLLGLRLGDLERPEDVMEALELLAGATRAGAAGLDVSDVLPRAFARVDEALSPAAQAEARRRAAVVAASALDAELATVLLDQADALDAGSDDAMARRLEVACRLLEPDLAASILADPARARLATLSPEARLDLSEVASLAGDLVLAADALEAARPLARVPVLLARVARLDATLRARDAGATDGAAAPSALSTASKLARDAEAPHEVGRAELALARASLVARDVARARAAFDAALEAAHSSGDELVGELARAAVAALGAATREARDASLVDRERAARAAGRSALARSIADLARLLAEASP